MANQVSTWVHPGLPQLVQGYRSGGSIVQTATGQYWSAAGFEELYPCAVKVIVVWEGRLNARSSPSFQGGIVGHFSFRETIFLSGTVRNHTWGVVQISPQAHRQFGYWIFVCNSPEYIRPWSHALNFATVRTLVNQVAQMREEREAKREPEEREVERGREERAAERARREREAEAEEAERSRREERRSRLRDERNELRVRVNELNSNLASINCNREYSSDYGHTRGALDDVARRLEEIDEELKEGGLTIVWSVKRGAPLLPPHLLYLLLIISLTL